MLRHPLPHRPSTARPLPLNSEGCDGRFYLQPQSFRLHSAHLGWPEPRTYEDGAGPGPAAVWTGFRCDVRGRFSRTALSESEDRERSGGATAAAATIRPAGARVPAPARFTRPHRGPPAGGVVRRRRPQGVPWRAAERPRRGARTRPPVWRVARQKFHGRAIPSVAWASASKLGVPHARGRATGEVAQGEVSRAVVRTSGPLPSTRGSGYTCRRIDSFAPLMVGEGVSRRAGHPRRARPVA